MSELESDVTSESIPRGKYMKPKGDQPLVRDASDARGNIDPDERTLKVQTSEGSSRTSFSFVINVDEEKDLKLFHEVNRRLKALRK